MAAALHKAAQNGDLAGVKKALEKPIGNIDACHEGSTAFAIAAIKGNTEIMRLLKARGASIEARDGDGDTPLIKAAGEGMVDAVNLLLDECDAPIETRGKYDETALIVAAAAGRLDTVNVLLDHNAILGASNKYGNTALILAAANGHKSVVQALLNKNLGIINDVNKNGETALMESSFTG